MSTKYAVGFGLVFATLLGCGLSTPPAPTHARNVEDRAKPVAFEEFAKAHGFRAWWPAEPTAKVSEFDDMPGIRSIFRAELSTHDGGVPVVLTMYVCERTEPLDDPETRERLLEATVESDNFAERGIATIERTKFTFGKARHLAVDATLTWSQDRSRVLAIITPRHTYRLSCMTQDREFLTHNPVERFIKSFELIE